MKRLLPLILFISLVFGSSKPGAASDYHQDSQTHCVVYTVTDNAGKPVSGLNPRMAFKRVSDSQYLDFNDNTFKSPSSATTLFAPMQFDQTGGFYLYKISVDSGVLVSGDYICVVSLDDASYGDVQCEGVAWDNLSNLIRIHR